MILSNLLRNLQLISLPDLHESSLPIPGLVRSRFILLRVCFGSVLGLGLIDLLQNSFSTSRRRDRNRLDLITILELRFGLGLGKRYRFRKAFLEILIMVCDARRDTQFYTPPHVIKY